MADPTSLLDRTEDINNPNSFYSLLTDAVKKKVDELPDEYLLMSEVDLKKEVTALERQLRFSLWHEYHRAQAAGTAISVLNTIAGICTKPNFYKVISNPKKLAFLIMPPPNHKFQMEDMLNEALERMREVLEIPIIKENGDYDIPAASLLHKVALSLHELVRGSVVQRHLNVNVDGTAPGKQNSPEEIDKRLSELRKKLANKASMDVKFEETT